MTGQSRSPSFIVFPVIRPEFDTNLASDEIIISVELPAQGFARNYTYLKIRDRLSYAFALVSVAVGLELEAETSRSRALALGGVAHKPWRAAKRRRFSRATAGPKNVRQRG